MKLVQGKTLFVAGLLLAALSAAGLHAETTTVTNGGSTATITQSGSSGGTQKQVRTGPGYTVIEQRSGSNAATIIQRSGSEPVDPAQPGTEQGPDMPPAADQPDGPPRDQAMTDADVYRQIRNGASPQSKQTLDNLMKAMGLQKKM